MATEAAHENDHVQSPTCDSVNELGPGMGGVWLVSSLKATTTHVWDLDAMTYRRQPGPESSSMEYDDVTVRITKVGAWPEVGRRSLVFFDDPEDELWEQWRICSTIGSITRMEPQEGGGAS
ncbi:hypothetical protein RKE38_10385 [Phycicoccus sp. M110.8]|uniref:hypothetical protein n=1 Tax=Phycicoccus sp. M110.8 TaxID=3075433 RepID=UPI0028FDAB8C|nr:hypothetical protein [Phycicoccus sp. M110.8]MDU0314092.1 hypothetical protein [Phycicoccus sp. M110.8]